MCQDIISLERDYVEIKDLVGANIKHLVVTYDSSVQLHFSKSLGPYSVNDPKKVLKN